MKEQNGQRSNSFKHVAQIGYLTDEETRLIYMGTRYYEPKTRRFVSEDLIGDGDDLYA